MLNSQAKIQFGEYACLYDMLICYESEMRYPTRPETALGVRGERIWADVRSQSEVGNPPSKDKVPGC